MREESLDIQETSFGFLTRLRFFQRAIRTAGLDSPGVRVLDVGCGTGELVAIPLTRLGFDVVGVDVDDASIRRARDLCRTARFIRGTAEEIAARGEKFDVVICSEVLEHLHRPEELLTVIRELLAPNGLLLVTVPAGLGSYESAVAFQRFYLKYRLRFFGGAVESPPSEDAVSVGGTLNAASGHVQFFRWREILRLFEKSGYDLLLHRGRTALCGPFLSRLIERHPSAVSANAWVAGRLPTRFAADWMFSLRAMRRET